VAHKSGVDRILVPISRDDRLWLREQVGTTGKSVAAQAGEVLRRFVRRKRRAPPRGGAAG